MQPVVVDLRGHLGKRIAVRVVDEHTGAWGHVNYDDFRFHSQLTDDLKTASLPRRLRTNPLLRHLRPNPVGGGAASGDQTAAQKTVRNMYVPDGFQADVVAAEPDLQQPIAFTFDARGRLWVAEAFSYPQKRAEGEGRDRITIFTDKNGDGAFETRTVFASGLNLVSGLEVGFGGVLGWSCTGAAVHSR